MFSAINGPLFGLFLLVRVFKGKEDRHRVSERFGVSGTTRPDGPLIWFHAASVGESLALITVIKQLLSLNPDLHVLVTTNTLTSAKILAQTLPERAFHQFQPIDTRSSTRRFLRKWRPDIAVWTESELWPRLMTETAGMGISMYLINARVSDRTKVKWRNWQTVVARLLNMFHRIAVQDTGTHALMAEIGVTEGRAVLTGSTKDGADTLDFDREELSRFQSIFSDRPVWLAASTHIGEDAVILKAQKTLSAGLAIKPVLIIAPRHPDRGESIRDLAHSAGFNTARRTIEKYPSSETDVFVADTMAELGLWYRLAKVSFVGGSLEKIGGHNPYEPIALGSAVLTGPHVFNFADIYQRLGSTGGCITVNDHTQIAQAVQNLLATHQGADMAMRATQTIQAEQSATGTIVQMLNAHLIENQR